MSEVRPMNFGACVVDALLMVMPNATFGEAADLIVALRRCMAEAGIVVIEPAR